MHRNSVIAATIVGGSIAGALDIVYAIVFWGVQGVSAVRILQSVASGVFGAAAYRGGVPIALIGLLLHFAIAFIIAALYVAASRRISALTQRPFTFGAAYGVAVYLVMNFIVVPLSAFPGEFNQAPLVVTMGVLAHMFLIGAPIALAAHRFR